MTKYETEVFLQVLKEMYPNMPDPEVSVPPEALDQALKEAARRLGYDPFGEFYSSWNEGISGKLP